MKAVVIEEPERISVEPIEVFRTGAFAAPKGVIVSEAMITNRFPVDVVERLGTDHFLCGQAGGDSITARVDPRTNVDPRDKVRLGRDFRSLHLFDHESERALL